jgi:hypothetical protein
MNYFKGQFDQDTFLFEVDDEYYCLRQINILANHTILTSNKKYDDLHFTLSEKPIIDFIDELSLTSKDEFEHYWSASNIQEAIAFEKIKERYLIGEPVTCKIECFYPQGVIMSNTDALFIINRNQLEKYYGEESVRPHFQVNCTVEKYDYINLWIIATIK